MGGWKLEVFKVYMRIVVDVLRPCGLQYSYQYISIWHTKHTNNLFKVAVSVIINSHLLLLPTICFQMGVYMSFPVTLFYYFNQPAFFQSWMIEKRVRMIKY